MKNNLENINVGSRCLYGGELYLIVNKNKRAGTVELFGEYSKVQLLVSADDITLLDEDEEFKERMKQYKKRQWEMLREKLEDARKNAWWMLNSRKDADERGMLSEICDTLQSCMDKIDI